MLIEDKERSTGLRVAIVIVCVLCLMGLSVLATYLILDSRYKKQANIENQKILLDNKNIKNHIANLSDTNAKLKTSLIQLHREYNNLGGLNKTLISMLHSAEQDDTQTGVKLKSALENLETAKADALKREGELSAKLQTFKDVLAPYLILEPTWSSSGQSTSLFDGNLTVALYQISPEDKSHKGAAAFAYLIEGKHKRKLFLQTGKPELFYYRGQKFLFNLLKSTEGQFKPHYFFTILREW